MSLTRLCLTIAARLLTSFLPWYIRARISVWTVEPPRVVHVSTSARLPVTWLQLTLGSLITVMVRDPEWPLDDEPLDDEPFPLPALDELLLGELLPDGAGESDGTRDLAVGLDHLGDLARVVVQDDRRSVSELLVEVERVHPALPAAESADSLPIRPRLQLSSMKRGIDAWSVNVLSTKFCFAHGEIDQQRLARTDAAAVVLAPAASPPSRTCRAR